MDIAMLTLHISGFKGIRDLTLDLGGASALLCGANGTGKTSVYDAFLWLLFGKDSRGTRADVKPLGEDGARVSGRDCEVTATLRVRDDTGERTVVLRKQWREVWTKPKGQAQPVYDRDETCCWINEVPRKIDREYLPYVLSLVGEDEDIFRLLSRHDAFMTLGWAERRRMLLKVTGGDADTALLQLPEYAQIPAILGGEGAEDAKKRLLGRRRTYNEQLRLLPARIDELERTLQPVSEAEATAARTEIARVQDELAAVDAELSGSSETAAQLDTLLTRKRKLSLRQIERKGRLEGDRQGDLNRVRAQIAALQQERQQADREDEQTRAQIARNQETAADCEARRVDLLKQYHAFASQGYTEPDPDPRCPACGRPLPEDQAEAARTRHRNEWEERKQADMAAVIRQGTENREALAVLTAENEAAQEKLRTRADTATGIDTKLAALRQNLKLLESLPLDAEADPDYAETTAALKQVEAEIAAMGTEPRREALRAQRMEKQAALEEPGAVLARVEESRRIHARIEELHREKAELGGKLADTEAQLALLGRFVGAWCSAMEEHINACFDTIRWQLFSFDKSGNLHDCCDATVNGVPYGAGLNHAAEINAGIEMIRVLSRAYGVTVPCFVDNAEAVNQVTLTDGQMILLKVTEDPTLTLTRLTDEPAQATA